MDFSLLGCDSETLRLVRYLTNSGRHRLVAVYACEPPPVELTQLARSARWSDTWEALLSQSHPGLVIVAPGQELDQRNDSLRQLAQADVPLLVVHPGCDAICGFELDMQRRDYGARLLPYVPGTQHPAVWQMSELRQRGFDSEIGVCRQLFIERHMPARDRAQVLAQLSRDTAIARTILGDMLRVSAMGSLAVDRSFANLSVHLSGPNDALVQWNLLASPSERISGRFILQGTAGRATLTQTSFEGTWELEIDGQTSQHQSWTRDEESPAVLAWLEQQLAHPTEPIPVGTPVISTDYDWSMACRDLEVIDAAEVSLRRGRAIDLQNETPTEEATFKAVMAAGGCGLLLATLLIIFLLAVVGGVQLAGHRPARPMANEDANAATAPNAVASPTLTQLLVRIWPVYPFAIFLILQLLLTVARRSRRPPTTAPPATGPPATPPPKRL